MFVCRKGALQNGKKKSNGSQLRTELKRMKRFDILHVLEEQGRVKSIRSVLELHGRQYMQLRVNRADATSDNTLTFKICLSTSEELRKYQKLILAACQFFDDIILFHSLDKHFNPVQRLISDCSKANSIKYEPLGRCFELCKDISTHHVDNLNESLRQQITEDSDFMLELLRFSSCHLREDHVHSMHRLLSHVQRLDLTGNDTIPSKALHILSNSLIQSTHNLKQLNLSSCKLTDQHLIDLQPCLHLVAELDLSYNEDMSPIGMRVITSSIHVANLTNTAEHALQKLVLAGCNLQDEHIQQLYNCIGYLQHLDLSGNTLLTAEAMKVISEAVLDKETDSSANQLQELRLESCGLTTPHIELLSPCIGKLRQLDLSWNVLDVASLQLISLAISYAFTQENSKEVFFQQLIISGCELTDEHLLQLGGSLKFIAELSIGYNRDISASSLLVIAQEIRNVAPDIHEQISCEKALTSLDLSGIAVDENDLEDFLTACKSSLKILDLTLSKLTDAHIQHLQLFFPYLVELHLGENPDLTPFGTKIISDVIVSRIENEEEMNLKVLDLKKCKLEDEHITYLIPCVKYLDKLDLSFNPLLTPKSMKLLSLNISNTDEHTKEVCLKELRIASCGFKDSHLVNLCGSFFKLQTLDISANNLTFITMLAIQKDLLMHCVDKVKLKELNIYQAFCLRDYHYRQFENKLRPYGLNIISVV